MKHWKTIPALLALIALLLPCTHLVGHSHDDCTPSDVCTEVHENCSSCTETVCSEKTEVLPVSSISPVELPVPSLFVLQILSTHIRPVVAVYLPDAALLPLQTVLLLI